MLTAIGSGELATPLHSVSTSSIREHVTRFPLPEARIKARIAESLRCLKGTGRGTFTKFHFLTHLLIYHSGYLTPASR